MAGPGPAGAGLLRRLGWRLHLAALTRLGRTVEIDGVTLRLDRRLSTFVRTHLYHGNYEAEELRALAARLAPDDVVMELGAGLGLLAAWAARRIGAARVFAYEANPAMEPHLRETFRLNGVAPALTMGLVGAAAGERVFHVEPDFWSSSSLARSGRARALVLPVLALEAELGRVRPTFLVMDVEGGEHELLGASSLPGVRKLLLELHPHVLGERRTAEVHAALARLGFAADPDVSGGGTLFLTRA